MNVSVEILIKDYFFSEPTSRLVYYKFLAAQLVTVDSIILVLDWGADGTVEDSWDGAVDLLSEIDGVLLQVLESEELERWKRGGLRLGVKMQRAIAMLAEGIAVASKIHPYLRLKGVLNCWSELRKYSSHEQDKNSATIVSAFLRAIETSDLNDLKDYFVPLLVESRADEYLDTIAKLMAS